MTLRPFQLGLIAALLNTPAPAGWEVNEEGNAVYREPPPLPGWRQRMGRQFARALGWLE
jgi:hypothetical protein